MFVIFFFFNDTATTEIYTLSLHDALPIAAYAPPRCRSCQHPLDEELHDRLVRPWLEGHEPAVTCAHCGATHPLGDWPDSYQVGELAVRFNNWPPLADDFLAELGAHLGPRWRVVHERY